MGRQATVQRQAQCTARPQPTRQATDDRQAAVHRQATDDRRFTTSYQATASRWGPWLPRGTLATGRLSTGCRRCSPW